MKRIGPKMIEVVEYVRVHPGCTKLAPATHVAPRGAVHYGYRTVNRALREGLVVALRLPSRYRLYVRGEPRISCLGPAAEPCRDVVSCHKHNAWRAGQGPEGPKGR